MTQHDIHAKFAAEVEAGQVEIVMIPWILGFEADFNSERHYVIRPTGAPEFAFLVHDNPNMGSMPIKHAFSMVCTCCIRTEVWQARLTYKKIVANICKKMGVKILFMRKPWDGSPYGLETYNSSRWHETAKELWEKKGTNTPFEDAFKGVTER